MLDNIITSQFLIFVPREKNTFATGTQHAFEKHCKSKNFQIIRSKNYFFAINTHDHQTDTSTEEPLLVSHVSPGKILSNRSIEIANSDNNWKVWHRHLETEAQVYNLIHSLETSFKIESDALGLMPMYRCHTSDGLIISSKILDLVSIFPDAIGTADRNSVAEFMMMGYPLSGRTLHKKITRAQTGEVFEWSLGIGEKITRPRRLRIEGKIRSDTYLHQALVDLEKALSQSIVRYTQHGDSPINVALSGGFDSRILAATIKNCNLDLNTFTYGRWHHRELRTARRVAKTLDVNHKILKYPLDHYYLKLPLFMSTMEGHGDSKTTQITNLFEIDDREGAPLIHGFLSDPIAGSHLSDWFPTHDLKSYDEVTDQLMEVLIPPTSQMTLLQDVLGFQFDLDHFRSEIHSELSETEKPYQAAVLWDIENRQRGLISSHLLMLGQKFDVIAPFYNKELLNRWITMPRIGLDKRYLQRQLLANSFPHLAKIPRDEENSPIIPNLKNQLLLFIDTLARKSLLRTYGRIFGYRPQSIWSLGHGMANDSQRNLMNSSIQENQSLPEEVFGLKLNLNTSLLNKIRQAPDDGDFQTPRFIFQLIEYARWTQAAMEKPIHQNSETKRPLSCT
ncbi:asparagine synthase-related protein [Pelagibius sp. Alg239-R121]|uniref:asparagine synthase-related protein n=1 Tax=Pelagibius sp. Alg239-R121 TaxID=2993448 RepID=UPI0024A6B033|nr:asparagine synthase-related protein [Pelagibius sp. Alg239-R121]